VFRYMHLVLRGRKFHLLVKKIGVGIDIGIGIERNIMDFGHMKPGSPPPFVCSPYPASMIDPDTDIDTDTERARRTEL